MRLTDFFTKGVDEAAPQEERKASPVPESFSHVNIEEVVREFRQNIFSENGRISIKI